MLVRAEDVVAVPSAGNPGTEPCRGPGRAGPGPLLSARAATVLSDRFPDSRRRLARVGVGLAAIAWLLFGWTPGAAAGGAPSLALKVIARGLANPVAITHAGDGTGRLFVTLQAGRIVILRGAGVAPTQFLDITSRVLCCGERGLLSVAFPPDYATSGLFYLYYTRQPDGALVIARYRRLTEDAGDPGSESVLLVIPHSANANHNGGQLLFGPDARLYAGVGDGGGAGDQPNNAQNPGTLLGKLLRLDVSAPPPHVPPDNPFVGVTGARPEIWALGLRNPWRFSFDRQTGDLFIADVGQNKREEVSFQPAGSAGGENYGWRLMEGSLCFNPPSACNPGGLVLPIVEYGHRGGRCSITGGYRYRGARLSELNGAYLFADFCAGRLWRATQDQSGTWTKQKLLDTGLLISAFGERENGELFVAHWDAVDGVVYRLRRGP